MKNKRLLRKLISEDCDIRHWYICDGKTCAIGKLALASGIKRATLRKAKGRGILCHNKYCELMLEAISKKFGLLENQIQEIQRRNDRELVKEHRRASILEYAKTL